MRGYFAELLAALRGNFGDVPLALFIIVVILIFAAWWLRRD
jgi:ribose/xylose/arabinose/galactoside ABC-type transport system permease subunit